MRAVLSSLLLGGCLTREQVHDQYATLMLMRMAEGPQAVDQRRVPLDGDREWVQQIGESLKTIELESCGVTLETTMWLRHATALERSRGEHSWSAVDVAFQVNERTVGFQAAGTLHLEHAPPPDRLALHGVFADLSRGRPFGRGPVRLTLAGDATGSVEVRVEHHKHGMRCSDTLRLDL